MKSSNADTERKCMVLRAYLRDMGVVWLATKTETLIRYATEFPYEKMDIGVYPTTELEAATSLLDTLVKQASPQIAKAVEPILHQAKIVVARMKAGTKFREHLKKGLNPEALYEQVANKELTVATADIVTNMIDFFENVLKNAGMSQCKVATSLKPTMK